MNPARETFGRLTIGTHKHTLGKAPGFAETLVRAAQVLKAERVTDTTVVVIELSFSRLPEASSLDRESQLLNELNSHVLTDPDEEIYPGVTLGRIQEVMLSESFIAYNELCQPDKRVGVEQSTIDLTRAKYEQAFPDCWPHFPLWIS